MPVARQGQAGRACSSIALDTPIDPPDAADATFATDNFQAGSLIGQWAKAKFEAEGKQAKIAMLDLNAEQRLRRRPARPGLPVRASASTSPTRTRSATSPTRGSSATTSPTAPRRAAARRWRTSSRRTRRSTSSTRSTSRPRRAPTQALKAAGKENDVTIVSVDGGCPGVAGRQGGPARRHLAAVPAEDGAAGRRRDRRVRQGRHQAGEHRRQDFVDTGVNLITDQPQTGVDVQGHHLRPAELLGLISDGSSGPEQAGVRPVTDPSLQDRPTATDEGAHAWPADTSSGGDDHRPARPPDRLRRAQVGVAGSTDPARPARQPDPGPARGPAPGDHRVLDRQRPVPLGGQPRAGAAAGHRHRVLALGQTLVILTAGIDLSAGAIAVFTSVIMANLATKAGLPGGLALIVGFLCGTGDGGDQRPAGHPAQAAAVHRHARHASIFFSLNSVVSRSETIRGSDMPADHDRGPGQTRSGIGGFRLTYGTMIMLLLFARLLLRAGPDGLGQARLRHR